MIINHIIKPNKKNSNSKIGKNNQLKLKNTTTHVQSKYETQQGIMNNNKNEEDESLSNISLNENLNYQQEILIVSFFRIMMSFLQHGEKKLIR